MRYETARRVLPGGLRRYIYSFEAMIEDAVNELAARLPAGSRVLDAGAGKGSTPAISGSIGIRVSTSALATRPGTMASWTRSLT